MLQRELNKVFDELCPDEQIWKIETLELNIGQIFYDNLEGDLSLKIRQHLRDKLLELIVLSNSGNDYIAIEQVEKSDLEQIRFYLLNGVVSWNHSDGVSINSLIADQLQHEPAQFIEMVRDYGGRHDYVRKRIAWQVNEPNMVKLVKKLEPANADEIVTFSAEMSKIQQQRNVIQTTSADFRQNSWLWILNYLLVERGTFYNRLAFLKSTLRQMAHHYNLAFDDLLVLILRAISEVGKKDSVNKTFTKSIWLLIEEHRFEESHVAQVEKIVRESGTKFQLGNLKKYQGTVSTEWSQLTNKNNDLSLKRLDGQVSSEDAFEVFLRKLPDYYASSYRSLRIIFIKALVRAGFDQGGQVINTVLREFLATSMNEYRNAGALASYMLKALAKSLSLSKSNLLRRLNFSDVQQEVKTLFVIEVCDYWIGRKELAIKHLSVYQWQEELNGVLKDATEQVKRNGKIEEVTAQKFRTFLLHSRADMLKLLADQDEKISLTPLLINDLTEEELKRLVKNSNSSHQSVFAFFDRVLEGIKNQAKQVNAKAWYIWFVETLVLDYRRSERLLFQAIQEYAYHQLAETDLIWLDRVFEEATSQLGIKVKPFERTDKRPEEEDEVILPASEFSKEAVLQWIKKGKSKGSLSNYLRIHFKAHLFQKGYTSDVDFSEKLIEFLIPGFSLNKAETFVKKAIAANKKRRQGSQSQKFHWDFLWSHVLDYARHQGNINSFEKLLGEVAKADVLVPDKISPVKTYQEEQQKNGLSDKAEMRALSGELQVLFERCLKEGIDFFEASESSTGIRDFLCSLFDHHTKDLFRLIKEVPALSTELHIIESHCQFKDAVNKGVAGSSGFLAKQLKSLRILADLVHEIGSAELISDVERDFWSCLWELVRSGGEHKNVLKREVKKLVQRLSLAEGFNIALLAEAVNENRNWLTVELKEIFEDLLHDVNTPQKDVSSQTDIVTNLVDSGLLHGLVEHLLISGTFPEWFEDSQRSRVQDWLNHIAQSHPDVLQEVIKSKETSLTNAKLYAEHWGIAALIEFLTGLERSRKNTLKSFEKLIGVVGELQIENLSGDHLKLILFRQLIKAFVSNNWRLVTSDFVLSEFTWELNQKYPGTGKKLISKLQAHEFSLPVSIRLTLNRQIEQSQVRLNFPQIPVSKSRTLPAKGKSYFASKQNDIRIPVKNAGLVLISGYIALLFERLNLLSDRQFSNNQMQLDAALFLQYVATGMTKTEEFHLPLNKVLCGLHYQHPVQNEIEISATQKKLIESLIQAIISHWPVIGACSINGFRGNWLIRDGILSETEERWELQVQKRAYDILINKSPFSFSIIHFPWMKKPLHVSWSY